MEANEEFEIFLNADADDRDSLKDIVCPPPNNQRTTAQRRWRLIKNMTHAQYEMKRLTSLTENEQSLLDSLASQESLADSALCAARRSIRNCIYSKSNNLTSAEVEFLHRLTEAPSITTEQLEHVQAVLLKDPLYANEVSKMEERDDEALQQERRSSIHHQRDASFRTQVWEYCKSDSLKSDSETSFSYHFQGARDDAKIDFPVTFIVLGTTVPDPECQPHVLSPPIMDALRPHLPFVVQQDNFWLKYSSLRDGFSMRSFLSKSRISQRTIVAVETMNGDIIGSFTSSPWREQGQEYYGSGEAFLWRLLKPQNARVETVQDQFQLETSEVEIFEWSGENHNVQRLVNAKSDLIVGGGGQDGAIDGDKESRHGSGLVLSPCLTRGHSHSCLTFGSPSLLQGDMFEIANIEVWTLTPVDNLEQAEKVELGRHFVFDQGNFALA